MITTFAKPPFLGYPPGEFEGWDRFGHVVSPAGKPEDFRAVVVKGLR